MSKKVTLIRDGQREEFDADHAKRMLAFQKQTGFTDFSEPTEPQATEPQTDSNNALNGSTGDSVDTKADKRGSAKTGS